MKIIRNGTYRGFKADQKNLDELGDKYHRLSNEFESLAAEKERLKSELNRLDNELFAAKKELENLPYRDERGKLRSRNKK